VAFDEALTPGQRHRRLDGGQVRPEPSGEAPEWREGTGGGARQPRTQLGRLALADEAGEVLRQGHRPREFGRLLGQLRQLVVILVGRSGGRRTSSVGTGGVSRHRGTSVAAGSG
jgi:hypothetical protein